MVLVAGCGHSEVIKVCTNEIEHSLKFPEDAEWKSIEVENRRENYFTVTGIVVAPNAFGANSRMEFDCKVEEIGTLAVVNYAKLDGVPVATADRLRRALGN